MAPSTNELKQKISKCKEEIKELKGDLQAGQQRNLLAEQKKPEVADPIAYVKKLITRRILIGHYNKVYSIDWAASENLLVSASQDGKLLIWNAFTTNKLEAIKLKSTWVMTCAFAPTGEYVASGGLDNVVSVYRLGEKMPLDEVSKVSYNLVHHTGYLSSCEFIDNTQLISSSGDSTCILWDIKKKAVLKVFEGHEGDCMSVSIDKYNNNAVFLSGSCDSNIKLWDYRKKKSCIRTFTGHETDVNAVRFFKNGTSFVSGSDDATVRVFETRSLSQLQVYKKGVTACGTVAPSDSGRLIFCGYEDKKVHVWDTLTGESLNQLQSEHEKRVSCLAVNKEGNALATGSWDNTIRLYA